MDAIEKRARELYAKAFREQGMELTAERLDDICTKIEGGSLRASLDAIKAALTPPEGYVLVPVELLRMVIGCAYPVSTDINQRGYAWSEAYLDQVLPSVKAALAAARPEVPS
ncbi:hypothetical protein JAK73_00275 [Stenotrophomonas maltophilia]|uniref:hypothetical protein n=1 Tax=Stenotrophomonas muris TaxID=2963283 RepID=UPI0021C92D2F|nr:hypothetical protein [Stenotrophomonas muris]MCU1116284.1 hypothetical protein [Stenotrophomonas maltophilia]